MLPAVLLKPVPVVLLELPLELLLELLPVLLPEFFLEGELLL